MWQSGRAETAEWRYSPEVENTHTVAHALCGNDKASLSSGPRSDKNSFCRWTAVFFGWPKPHFKAEECRSQTPATTLAVCADSF